ncbi:MAG TPA: site-specific DNA-methyltransferase, partial [Anaerohalosphaeraceae bacterium]|nr:site-specific DNA-methyltransferase [Anaerohalosphaeraceae bacterium]
AAEVKSQHRLLCGDSPKQEDVSLLMDGQTASICWTSPPYNVGDNSLGGNKNRVESKYLNDDDDKPQAEYRDFLIAFTTLALQTAQTIVINLQSLAGNKVAIIEWLYHFRNHFVDRLVWYKGGGQPAMAANVMNSRFEDVWILSPQENPKRCIPTGRFQSTVPNVYEGRGASGENVAEAIHAAVMPMHFALHILTSMDGTAGIVYEPFAGSGTTLIAAEKLGRRCFAIEIDPIYCDTVINRYEQFTGKRAVRRSPHENVHV